MATRLSFTYANIVFSNVAVREFTTVDYIEGGIDDYVASSKLGNINGVTNNVMSISTSYLYRRPTDADYLEGKIDTLDAVAILKPNVSSYAGTTQVSMSNNNPNQISVVTDGQDPTLPASASKTYWILS